MVSGPSPGTWSIVLSPVLTAVVNRLKSRNFEFKVGNEIHWNYMYCRVSIYTETLIALPTVGRSALQRREIVSPASFDLKVTEPGAGLGLDLSTHIVQFLHSAEHRPPRLTAKKPTTTSK